MTSFGLRSAPVRACFVLLFLGALAPSGCQSDSPAGSGGNTGNGGSSATGGTQASGGATGSGGSVPKGSGGASGAGGAPSSGGVTTTTGTATGGAGGSTTSNRDAAADAPVDAPMGSDVADAQQKDDLHIQATRPALSSDACGNWTATEGVCCAQYCSNDNTSESCDKCGGKGAAQCQVVNAKACTSGQWPEVHQVGDSEDWHYSRSTHFGTAPSGACRFHHYGMCSATAKLPDPIRQKECDSFCKWYPDLCKDPAGITLRGNFAAPQGNYYTQFWPSLPGDYDNYLSCGECFQIERTQDDGTLYQSGAGGYTPPLVLQVADSCPCSANSKWCCGSGRDHCGEVEGKFKYGCQLPPSPPPPVDHDPLSSESIHFDLDDVAMARLQTGDPAGTISDGVIPTHYKRVPCPVVGNIHIAMEASAGDYYFAIDVVNMAGLGAPTNVEAQLPSGQWIQLTRDPNYKLFRPQERTGTWATPQGAGPFALPVTLRISEGSGRSVVAKDAIKSWEPADKSQILDQVWFIDLGVQF
jgi:hypothetical protein